MPAAMAPIVVLPYEPDLFGLACTSAEPPLETTAEIDLAIARGAPVFCGVSGGKDSQALAWRVRRHLDDAGHAGPRFLIHSDLGRVEWRQSLPTCERLAERLGVELIVVRRLAGDLMDRWTARWDANVRRYAGLECVKLVLPWSTPSTRFCTSELKSAVIASAVRRRFPTGDVISATGVRREESRARARMPVAKRDERLSRRSGAGHTWNALLGWTRRDVLHYLHACGETLHEAYTTFHSTRVSCTFCIMSSLHDLQAAASCTDNAAVYREIVRLETRSTFSFQGSRWLADVAPDLLAADERADAAEAKERAAEREAAEALLPERLLFVQGWPTEVPSIEDARLIARVRRRVAEAARLTVDFIDATSVQARYVHLMQGRLQQAAAASRG